MFSDILAKIDTGATVKNILIIDGTNQLIRALSVYQRFGKTLYGLFFAQLATVLNKFKPTQCYLVFDGQGGNFVRRKIFAQYKMNRSAVSKIQTEQYNELFGILRHTPIVSIRMNNVQGDDIIAHLAIKNENLGHRVTIVSGDKDFFQLCSPSVTVWSPIKKMMVTEEYVKALFACHPVNFAILKALMGDASDNIPGIKGVGQKTVEKYLKSVLLEYSPVEGDLTAFKQQLQKLPFSDFKTKLLTEFDNIKTYFKLVNLRNGCGMSPQIGVFADQSVKTSVNQFDRGKFVEACNKFKVNLSEIVTIVPALYAIKRK